MLSFSAQSSAPTLGDAARRSSFGPSWRRRAKIMPQWVGEVDRFFLLKLQENSCLFAYGPESFAVTAASHRLGCNSKRRVQCPSGVVGPLSCASEATFFSSAFLLSTTMTKVSTRMKAAPFTVNGIASFQSGRRETCWFFSKNEGVGDQEVNGD